MFIIFKPCTKIINQNYNEIPSQTSHTSYFFTNKTRTTTKSIKQTNKPNENQKMAREKKFYTLLLGRRISTITMKIVLKNNQNQKYQISSYTTPKGISLIIQVTVHYKPSHTFSSWQYSHQTKYKIIIAAYKYEVSIYYICVFQHV